MGVTEVPRSLLCGQGVAETEADLTPGTLQITLGRDAADGCKQVSSRKRRRGPSAPGTGLSSRAEMWSSRFGGNTGWEAILKKGVLGKKIT